MTIRRVNGVKVARYEDDSKLHAVASDGLKRQYEDGSKIHAGLHTVGSGVLSIGINGMKLYTVWVPYSSQAPEIGTRRCFRGARALSEKFTCFLTKRESSTMHNRRHTACVKHHN